MTEPLRLIAAGALEIGHYDLGPPDGPPVVLLHGFPYAATGCLPAARLLAGQGRRVLVPWLRGFGPTRFLGPGERSGQQAALAEDLRAFLDALAIPSAVLAGYDWGGRAACILAALHPDRVAGLVSGGSGCNILDHAAAAHPATPDQEHRHWYQHYFRSDRGRAGLTRHRTELCRLLWRLWSPGWAFTEAEFAEAAESFENPDFVEVTIHSYRHRFGGVPGDPGLDAIERALAARPAIAVPTLVLHGAEDGVDPCTDHDRDAPRFIGPHQRRVLPGVGHNVIQEAPEATAAAVLALA